MKRYVILDRIRGITLISMILYHAVWDMVYLFHVDWGWYRTAAAYLWQQSICWTFIFLSGFCWSLGKRKWRRGLEVFLAGALVSAATLVFMPQERVFCGVLTLIGTGMLLVNLLSGLLERVGPVQGLAGSMMLFVLSRNVNGGFLGFEGWNLVRLPESLYRNLLTACLGFPPGDFYSADYFSLFPWVFLYAAGYFAYRFFEQRGWLACLQGKEIKPLEWPGKHSLIIYLLHQPLIYAALLLLL